MLGELVDFVTKLFEFSDRWTEAEDKKRQSIKDYFRSIEQCLRDSAEQLKKGQVPHDKWAELQSYADKLPKTIIDEIGEDKARQLCNLLKITASNTPDKSYIESIEKAAGQFKALSVMAAIGHRPENTEVEQKKSLLNFISPSRRAFIWTTVGTSVGLTAGWLAGQNAGKNAGKNLSMPLVKWKMVSLFGENTQNLIIYKVPQIISDRLKKVTDGRFTIDIDTNSAIQTEDILREVHRGTIQCGFSGIYYIQDRYQVLFFGCAIPFGLSPQEHSAWLLYKKNPNDELSFMQRVYSEKLELNVIPFPVAATGGQMGGWFKQEIHSVADFNGLTMRLPGLGGEILRTYFGAIIDRNLPGGAIPIDKIKGELAKDTIKAAEWIGPYDDYQLELHEVAKYYYYPGWWEPSTTFDVLVNKSEWDKLPPKYQKIFKAVCLETYTKILAEYDIKNSEVLQKLRNLEKLGNIQLVRFSDQILQEAQNKTNALLKLYSSKNTIFKEVYSEWNSFKNRIRDWSNLNKI
jgi:TRAP-type mannitol/chloroaromatic compound transport system substrate-binding protein